MGLWTKRQPRGGPRARRRAEKGNNIEMENNGGRSSARPSSFEDRSNQQILPTAGSGRNHNGHKITPGIQPEGESGRKGIHPIHFLKICWTSSSRFSLLSNLLWPFVPAAIVVKYKRHDLHVWIFALNYLAMIPCANLIGFAGQELSRKLHKVFGVLLETTLGSIVEIVMFMVLLRNDQIQVIQAAILGSILATQLLCLGMCFAVGGLRHDEQSFDQVLGEVGSDLLLTA